ncbi:MAG: AmmeMemoRadiSam system protein B [Endomicrobia bacterium]|nr:AmmeMemoRadiSam system protein B [Endomicrobiia bacterium]
MSENSFCRQPYVAGQFYPYNKEELVNTIEIFFKNIKTLPKEQGKILAVISPHAGYIYSGQTASYAYKFLQCYKIENPIIILLGQSHHFHLSKASVYSKDSFLTPLGEAKIEKDFVSLLLSNSNYFEESIQPHLPEHSLEVQLPFLQYIYKQFSIVPILVSSFDVNFIKKIAEILADCIKKYKTSKKIIIVCSTDMSHYPSYEDARSIDLKAIEVLKNYDIDKFYNTTKELEKSKVKNLYCVFCADTAVGITIYTTKLLGGNHIEILNYSNSGDSIYGDKTRVVGYLSAAFIEKQQIKGENLDMKKENQEEFKITEENQKVLLYLARQAIKEYIYGGKMISYKTDNKELLTPQAVFVTLTKKGQLRGCIGTTFPQYPLYQAVINMAIAAANEDPRFPPVKEEELDDIKIEISVLSPLKRVFSHKDIKEKIHGVVVRSGSRSGLFLPQVWEQLPKKEQFLSELCWSKAGLQPNAWQDSKTELYVFTVFAFEEH